MASALAVRGLLASTTAMGMDGAHGDHHSKRSKSARVDPLLYGRALQAWACSGALNEWRDVRGLPQSDERQ